MLVSAEKMKMKETDGTSVDDDASVIDVFVISAKDDGINLNGVLSELLLYLLLVMML